MSEMDGSTLPDENSRIEQAMEEYLEHLEAGTPVNREQFLSNYPDLRIELSEQLEALEYLHLAKPEFVEPSSGERLPDDVVAAGATLGDFQLVRPIGRGGMAIVYEARQLSLDRIVAVKILPFAAVMDARQLQRFQNESRAAAALDHPNIVPVYFVGQDRGVHFFAMQLIEGQCLADWIAQARADATEPNNDRHHFATSVGIQACDALQLAHEQGVVHRDVKPSNLLIDENKRVFLSDFGLARFDGAESITRTGDIIGTLDYMSPEHLSGSNLIDARSDLYSLGATLYELISLQKPFESESHRGQFNFEHRKLRRVDANIPTDLETVISKAMASEPADRYDTAAEMGDDLRRFRDGQPIMARRPSYVDRAAKWARRHSRLSSGIAIAACCMFAALSVATLLVWQAQRAANVALSQATVHSEKVERLLYLRSIQSAFRAWNRDHEDQAREILQTYVTEDVASDQRGFEWYALNSLVGEDNRRLIGTHDGPVNQIATFLSGDRIVTVGADKVLKIWELPSCMLHKTIDVGAVDSSVEALYSVVVSPDGKWLATGSDEVLLWNVETGSKVRQLTRFDYNVASIAFSPDGERIAAASRYDRIRLLTLNGEVINEVDSPSRNESLHFTADGNQILCPFRVIKGSRRTNLIRAWKSDLSGFIKDYGDEGYTYLDVSLSESFLLAAQIYKGAIELFDTGSGSSLHRLELHHGNVAVVAVSPDSSRIAAGFDDGGVICWSIAKRSNGQIAELVKLRRFQAHEGGVNCIRFTNDGDLVTCGEDGKVRLLELQLRGNPTLDKFAHVWHVEAAAASRAAFAVVGRKIEVIDKESLTQMSNPTGNGRLIRISPGNQHIAIARSDTTLEILRLPSCDSEGKIEVDFEIGDMDFSPDESQVAVVGGDGVFALHSIDTLQQVRVGKIDGDVESPGYHCVFSPDGQHLICGAKFNAIAVLSLNETAENRSIPVVSKVTDLEFSHCGRLLLSCHADGVVRLWDWPTGDLWGTLIGHAGEVYSAAFSHDDSVLATTGTDGTARLWSVPEKLELGILLRRPKVGRVIEFCNNDRTLYVGFGGSAQYSLATFRFDAME